MFEKFLPVDDPLDGDVPVGRVWHLVLAGGAAAAAQLVVALLADDVGVGALVDPALPHRHAHGALQLPEQPAVVPLHVLSELITHCVQISVMLMSRKFCVCLARKMFAISMAFEH